jgi:hypothetical protein
MKTDCVGTFHLNRKDTKNSEREETEKSGNYSSAFWPSARLKCCNKKLL